MRATALWLVALLVVPAGVLAAPLVTGVGAGPPADVPATAGVAPGGPATADVPATDGVVPDGPAATGSGPDGQEAPPDPETDRIGWENGYWHNESIAVDQSDGLTADEREAYVARSMARVEYIREKEFTAEVPVSVRTREEYRNGSRRSVNLSQSRWNNQVWEAPLVVGEDRNVSEELQRFYGEQVAGFYSPDQDSIVVVTDTPDRPVIDNATLVHELVHALQDQQFNLSAPRYRAETQDGDLADNGLVEGEANYVEARYVERCGAAWDCVVTPAAERGGGGGEVHLGISLTVFQPYADGPAYVHRLVEREGWAAVDALHQSPPTATEQIIHGLSPADFEDPPPIEMDDTATGGWRRFADQGVDGSDTVGEATIFAGFWYQSREYGAGPVRWGYITDTTGQYDRLNYSSGPSAGWANDRVVPYHNPDEREDAYVWTTKWDTERDAVQFADAYVEVLSDHDAERVGDHTYVVPDGPFADAFRVVQEGRTVTVVNGPDRAALDDLRPGLAEPATDGGDGGNGGSPLSGLPLRAIALAAAGVLLLVLVAVAVVWYRL